MKHIHPETVEAVAVKPPNRRALAKQQTRMKVMAAARRLFSEEGYEGATIRDIATTAGMSTGAVFANFADKSDLFREIVGEDQEALVAAMRDAAERGRNLEDSLLKIYMAGYTFYSSRLQLARAAFSVSWDAQGGSSLRGLPSTSAPLDLFAAVLAAAVDRGEISEQSDVKLRSQMLFDTYLSNFPQAIFAGWGLDAIQVRARDQIRILMAGARRG